MASPFPNVKVQFTDSNGVPLIGGKVYTYAAGTSTPKATYTTVDGGVANTNPVILDARGEADIWLGSGGYKVSLYTSADVLVWTRDDITTSGDLEETILDQFAASSGSSLVGHIASGSGMETRTVQSKLRDVISITDGDGLDPTGATNSRAAIQAVIDAAPDGSTIYFQGTSAGKTYLIEGGVSNSAYGITLSGRNGISLIAAPGVKLVADDVRTTQRTITVGDTGLSACTDIHVEGFTFDAAGRGPFAAGLAIYNTTGVHVSRNRFIDSAFVDSGQDHDGCIVITCEDVWVNHNYCEHRKIELSHCRRGDVSHNILYDVAGAGSIMLNGNSNGAYLSDIDIHHNIIIDSKGDGVGIGAEGTTGTREFQRIHVHDNMIAQLTVAGENGVKFQISSGGPTATIYDVKFERNTVFYGTGMVPAGNAIKFITGSTGGLQNANACVINNNDIIGYAHASKYAIDTQPFIRGEIGGNNIVAGPGGTTVNGIRLLNAGYTTWHDNVVEASGIAYRFQSSAGNNKWWNNVIIGSPTTGYSFSSAAATDEGDRGIEYSVASAATITLPLLAPAINITGTTNIDTITARTEDIGRLVTLRFSDVLTVGDGTGNLKLASNFATTADDTLTLRCHGNSWWEVARSVN